MYKTLRKFFDFCDEKNRRQFYASLVFGVVEALFSALKIPAIGVCLYAVLNGDITPASIGVCLGIMFVSVFGQAVCKYFSTMQQTRGGYRTCANKRIEIAGHMRYMPMGYFKANSLGRITSVATNTMQNLENVATRVVMLVTTGLMTTAMMTVMMFLFDARIGAVCVAGICVFAAVNYAMRNAGASFSEKKADSDTLLVEKVLEYIQGIAVVKSYHLVGKMAKQCSGAIDENVKANTQMEMAFIPWVTLQNFTADLTGVAISVFSVYFYCNGTLSLIYCVLLLVSSLLVTQGLKTAGAYSSLLRIVDVSVDKADEILQTPVMKLDGKKQKPFDYTLEAKNISFAYENKKVIDGISLVIPEKTTTAIVGPSGSGKTTLCQLLSRFWDVDGGSVTLGGMDVREYDMDSLMENFSFVFQNVTLFEDTAANNIRFGQPDASMDAVIAAAKKARCHDFIMELPDGYETVIGENGQTLSGGERQRISIARAIMKDAPVIILDEATANVDPENEKELMEAIHELTREKTVIMIAHRLKTVQNADQIIVINNGRIAQQGTHEQLIAKEGIYRRFVEERRYAAGWKLS